MGSVLPHTEAKLTSIDENGNEFIVDRNEIGELKVRGYWYGFFSGKLNVFMIRQKSTRTYFLVLL